MACRGSPYFRTTKAGEIDRGCPTQVGRALEPLGVEPIGACSPQSPSRDGRPSGRPLPEDARSGRSRRFKIAWRKNSSLPEPPHSRRPTPSSARSIRPPTNASFAVEPAGEGSAFTPSPRVNLDEIPCVQEERQVMNDKGVSDTRKRPIPESPMRPPFVKARVKVHLYPDGSHALFHRPRRLGRCDETGRRQDDGPVQRAAELRSAAANLWTWGPVDMGTCGHGDLWTWGRRFASPTSPQENRTRSSRQFTPCQNRTPSFAIDRILQIEIKIPATAKIRPGDLFKGKFCCVPA